MYPSRSSLTVARPWTAIPARRSAPSPRSPFRTVASNLSARCASRNPPTMAEETFKLMTASRAAIRSSRPIEATIRLCRSPTWRRSRWQNSMQCPAALAVLPGLPAPTHPVAAALGHQGRGPGRIGARRMLLRPGGPHWGRRGGLILKWPSFKTTSRVDGMAKLRPILRKTWAIFDPAGTGSYSVTPHDACPRTCG